jgi:hypothetical protein
MRIPEQYKTSHDDIILSAMVQVFLSSTARDLSDCRTLAYQAIEGLAEYHCVGKHGSELATMVVQAIHNWESSPAEHYLVRVTALKSGATRDIRLPFLRLGRNPESEVPISDDPDVSWDHGVVFQHAGEFFYRHLGQTNPAWITAGDRQIVTPPCEKHEIMLQARNKVRVGTTEFGIDVVISGGRPKLIPANKQDHDG